MSDALHCWNFPPAQAKAAVAPEDVLVVDIEALARDPSHRTLLLDRAMRTHDMDNERFLRKVRERLDRCCSVENPGPGH